MADDDTHPGMTKLSRGVHGPRPIGALVPVVARTAFGRVAPGVARLSEAWPGIVGPTLAAVTEPRRLIQGTLTVGCSGPVAMELQYLSDELLGRVNQYLGSSAVRNLRFAQTITARPPPRAGRIPTKEMEQSAAEAVAHLPEGPLRSALAALGRAVLIESASRLGKQPRTRC